MDEKEIGAGLIRLDGEGTAESELQALTEKLLRRDRRRVGILATVSVVLWVAAASGFFLLGYLFFTAIVPKLQSYARRPPSWNEGVSGLWITIGSGAVTIVLGSVVAFLLAAISTVVLIVTSRRATLRQINASLQRIARELQELRATRTR
jgi:uncharacterized membrane protein